VARVCLKPSRSIDEVIETRGFARKNIDPLSAYVTFLLGLCLCTAGRMDEAIETCRRAVQQDAESFVAIAPENAATRM